MFGPRFWGPLYFGPRYFPRGSGTTDDFFSALRARFQNTAGLADLSDVYLRQTGPKPTYPFLVMTDISAYPEINTTDSYFETVNLQFNVFAEDEPTAADLGAVAFGALLPIDANPALRFADGYEMIRLPGMNRIGLDPGLSSGGKPVWNFMFSYRFLIGRNP